MPASLWYIYHFGSRCPNHIKESDDTSKTGLPCVLPASLTTDLAESFPSLTFLLTKLESVWPFPG